MAGPAPSRAELSRALAFEFRDAGLLEVALTHRSSGTPNNERLEFLGDALLNCVVAILVFERLPRWPEGDLSRLRSSLVNQASLVAIAERLKIGHHLRLGDGELKSGGFRRPSILADAVEAVIGAIYLDAGFIAAKQVIEHLWGDRLADPDTLSPPKDAKTALQEVLQGQRLPLPRYVVQETAGDQHDQTFTVECLIDAMGITTQGTGTSRRAAEQDAARHALVALRARKAGAS